MVLSCPYRLVELSIDFERLLKIIQVFGALK